MLKSSRYAKQGVKMKIIFNDKKSFFKETLFFSYVSKILVLSASGIFFSWLYGALVITGCRILYERWCCKCCGCCMKKPKETKIGVDFPFSVCQSGRGLEYNRVSILNIEQSGTSFSSGTDTDDSDCNLC